MVVRDPSNDPDRAPSSPSDPSVAADMARTPGEEAAQGPQRPAAAPARPRRRWRVLLLALPVAVAIIAGLALGAYLYMLGLVTVSGTGLGRPASPAFASPLRLTDRVNVLIIGIDVTLDNRRRVLNVARADTLVLASFDPHRRRIVALSIPRDTRAEIPRVGVQKINASYAYGGPRLTIATVEHLLGVKVHFYVKLGPQSFARIIDALGGIEVDVEKDMKYTDSWAGYTIDLKKGRQRLNGEQATGYIRFRHDALGDIGRVERQRQVMHTLLGQLRQPSTVLAAPRLLRAFVENTESNLRPLELLTLGWFALRADGGPLREYTLPGTFAPMFWEPDLPRVRILVADLFYGVSEAELATVPIEVVNASGHPAVGWQAAARLQAFGFRMVRLRAATVAGGVTTVTDRGGGPHVARMVAAAMGKAVVTQGSGAPVPGTSSAGVTVILGRDAAENAQGTSLRRANPH